MVPDRTPRRNAASPEPDGWRKMAGTRPETAVKLHLAAPSDQNLLTGYGPGFVAVNRMRVETSVIVLPERLIEPWEVADFAGLAPEHFEFLAGLGVDIVLLGTGARLRFPAPSMARALAERRIGLEAMDTGAACRTYNILVQEGRRVAAALIVP